LSYYNGLPFIFLLVLNSISRVHKDLEKANELPSKTIVHQRKVVEKLNKELKRIDRNLKRESEKTEDWKKRHEILKSKCKELEDKLKKIKSIAESNISKNRMKTDILSIINF